MENITFIDNFKDIPINHCVNEITLRNKIITTYHQPASYGMRSLADITKPGKIIILGSASNITEPEAWHGELLEYLVPHIENGVPTLAICFGHQLMVHHYGGEVGYINADKTNYEILRSMKFQQNVWGVDFGDNYPMPYAHQQIVKKIPNDFEILASSDVHAFEFLKHKKYPLWTLQGHPESSLKFIKEYLHVSDETLALKIKSEGNKLIDAFIRNA